MKIFPDFFMKSGIFLLISPPLRKMPGSRHVCRRRILHHAAAMLYFSLRLRKAADGISAATASDNACCIPSHPSALRAKSTIRLSLPDFIRAFPFSFLFPQQYVTRFRIAQTYFLQVFIVTKIDMAMEIGYS